MFTMCVCVFTVSVCVFNVGGHVCCGWVWCQAGSTRVWLQVDVTARMHYSTTCNVSCIYSVEECQVGERLSW